MNYSELNRWFLYCMSCSIGVIPLPNNVGYTFDFDDSAMYLAYNA